MAAQCRLVLRTPVQAVDASLPAVRKVRVRLIADDDGAPLERDARFFSLDLR